MISQLIELSKANRFFDIESRSDGATLKGDFEGSVTGTWIGLGPMGEGVVSYKSKQYLTKPIGFVSIPAGTEVQLSYAKGLYYSAF